MDVGATSKGRNPQHNAGEPRVSLEEKAIQSIVDTINRQFQEGVNTHRHDPLTLKYSIADTQVQKITDNGVPFINAMRDIEKRLQNLGVDVLGKKEYGDASGLSSHISVIYTFTLKFPE